MSLNRKMRRRLISLNIITGLIVILVLSGNVIAEEKEEYELETIVVTATRTEQKIKDLSGSVAVVTRMQIEQADAREVPDLLESIPGVQMRDTYGNGTKYSFGLRGVNPGRCNKVLVMVNGVPMNSGHTGTVFWRDLPSLDQIERVEVVKGPVSALYGGFGIGGAVNIITKRGAIQTKTALKTEFGSNSEKRLSAETGGNAGEKLSYQVGYAHQEGDGFRDRSAFETDKVSTKLGYLITSRSGIELDVSYVENYHEVAGDLTLEQFEENPSQAESQIGDSDLERVFMNLVYRSDIGEDDNLRISVYHHTYDLDYVFTSGTGNYIYAVDTTGGEFQYTLKNKIMGRQNTLIFGPSIRTDSADTQAYETDEQGGKTDEIKSDTLAEPVFWAFYIQDELKLTESLSMTLGLRYDRAEFENLDRLDPEDSGEAEMDAVSPKFGLAYKLFPHTTLFANVGKGFAPPSISNLYTSANSNPDLDPETAMNYELSMRTAPVDWLDLTTTIYQMDVTDEIISVEVDGDAKKINAGETRHKGLETELNLHFPMGFTSFVNLTLQDVKFEDHKVYSSRSGTTTVYDGNKLPHAPDKQLTAGLRYRHPIGLICSLTVRYEDEKYTDEANRYLIPDYTVWSTRLEYKNKYKDIKYSFRLSVNNLFDKNYYSSGTGSSVYPSAPRTYLLGATVTF